MPLTEGSRLRLRASSEAKSWAASKRQWTIGAGEGGQPGPGGELDLVGPDLNRAAGTGVPVGQADQERRQRIADLGLTEKTERGTGLGQLGALPPGRHRGQRSRIDHQHVDIHVVGLQLGPGPPDQRKPFPQVRVRPFPGAQVVGVLDLRRALGPGQHRGLVQGRGVHAGRRHQPVGQDPDPSARTTTKSATGTPVSRSPRRTNALALVRLRRPENIPNSQVPTRTTSRLPQARTRMGSTAESGSVYEAPPSRATVAITAHTVAPVSSPSQVPWTAQNPEDQNWRTIRARRARD